MVQPAVLKVKYLLDVSKECVQQSISAIDKDMNQITKWMQQCIQTQEIIQGDIKFTTSNENLVKMSPLVLSTTETTQSDDIFMNVNDPRDQKELENDIFKKYNAMAFKDLKEECNRLGIICSGLRNEYVKKLVTYELSKNGIYPSHPITPLIHPTQTEHKPVQRPPVLIPQLASVSTHSSIQSSPRETKPVGMQVNLQSKFSPALQSTSKSTSQVTSKSTSQVTSQVTSKFTSQVTSQVTSKSTSQVTSQVTSKPTLQPTSPPRITPLTPRANSPRSISPRFLKTANPSSPQRTPYSSQQTPNQKPRLAASPPLKPQHPPPTIPMVSTPQPKTNPAVKIVTNKIDTIENKFKKPPLPTWASGPNLKEAITHQTINALYGLTADAIFTFPETMDLEVVLGIYLRREVNIRGSSGNWTQEVIHYNQLIGQVDLSDDGITAYEGNSDSDDSWYSLLSE